MSNSTSGKFILIGWDGAEWDFVRPLMREGKLPNFTRLVESGVCGDLASFSPRNSNSLWTSVATGKRAFKHGIVHHLENVGATVAPPAPHRRAALTIWNILDYHQVRSAVINWPVSHPAEPVDGVCISEAFPFIGPTPNGVSPASIASSLADFLVLPEHITDIDLQGIIPSADRSEAHPLVEKARESLAEMVTVHALATQFATDPSLSFYALMYRGIEQFSHLFAHYASPKLASVSQPGYERFKDVIFNVYQFHDQMLGRLIQLLPADTTFLLCSDHGFATGVSRPEHAPSSAEKSIQLLHRPRGLFVFAGPNVQVDETLEGVTLFDIAPTTLAHFNIPRGRDMDGKPMTGAFKMLSPLASEVPSWEAIMPLPTAAVENSHECWSAAQHLLALGYSDPFSMHDARALAVYHATLFGRAESYFAANRYADAVPYLQYLRQTRPTNVNYCVRLFNSLYLDGDYGKARELLDDIAKQTHENALVELGYATLEIAQNRVDAAADRLQKAKRLSIASADIFVLLGNACFGIGQFDDAQSAFESALAIDNRLEHGWNGLAAVKLAHRHYSEARAAAAQAVSICPVLASAHYHLAIASFQLNELPLTQSALLRVLEIEPDHIPARRKLIELYENRDAAAALEHQSHLIDILSLRKPDIRSS